jgi:DnaK suppressor protein
MTRKQLNSYKKVLQAQRAEILRAFARDHRDYKEAAEVAADLFDRATIDDSREFAAYLQHGESQRWYEINTALARIESGDYGRCEECGQPISEERLKAVPTAALCVVCQKNFEAQQAVSSFGAARISDELWEREYLGD